MAKATKVPGDYEITLTLSRDEAETLILTMGRTVGGNQRGKRAYAIYRALDDAGVVSPATDTPFGKLIECSGDTIRFK